MSSGFWANVLLAMITLGFAIRWLIMWIRGRSNEIPQLEYIGWSIIGITMMIAIVLELMFN